MTGRPGRRRPGRRRPGRRRPGGGVAARVVGALLLAGLAVLVTATAASAHASLLRTDPADGAVLRAGPSSITLTFDETVTLPPDAVQVFDARGDPVHVEVHGRDAVVSATVPVALSRGTYVVPWRVISADGHPVAGSISFSVGAPSAVVTAPRSTAESGDGLRTLVAVAGGADYLGLLVAGGLVLFRTWTVAGVRLRPPVARRLLRVATWAAVLAVLSAVLLVAAHGAEDLGVGWRGLGQRRSLALRFVGDDVLVLGLEAGGLATALLLCTRRWAATAGALVAVAGPSAVGHSRAVAPVWLLMTSDVAHLVAAATWLGGLVGLAVTLPSLRGRDADAATVLARFSSVGAVTLGVLAVTGTVAAWRIVGSWAALVGTGYGRLLLVKVGVVASVAAVAGLNRFLLVPRVRHGPGPHGPAVLRVRTAVRTEALLLVAVLALTGFLVGLSPLRAPGDGAGVVGHDRVRVSLSPGRVGPNTLTLRVQDRTGGPARLYDAPTVALSSGPVDLGQVRVRTTAAGTYQARVVLPRSGTWHVQVGLRLTRFDNPVTSVDVVVG